MNSQMNDSGLQTQRKQWEAVGMNPSFRQRERERERGDILLKTMLSAQSIRFLYYMEKDAGLCAVVICGENP